MASVLALVGVGAALQWGVPQPDGRLRPTVCLNGEWRFQAADDRLTFPPGQKWDPIPIRIPSPWNVNAFTRGDGGDFVCFPSYPKAWEEVQAAWHRRTFSVPVEWQGKRVFLRFEAVHYWADVYVNGQKVGSHEGGFTPFELDITEAVRFGSENELIVGVKDRRFFDVDGRTPYGWGSFWGEAIRGIWQDVYLLAKPQVYGAEPFVHYSLGDRMLHVEVSIVNTRRGPALARVEVSVFPWNGGEWRNAPTVLKLGPAQVRVEAGGRAEVRLRAKWPDAKLWWPDEPNLYVAAIRVFEGDGRDIEDELPVRFGCKESRIGPEGKFLLNGRVWTGRGDAWHFMGIPQMTPEFPRLWYSMAKGIHINVIRLHAQVYPEYYLDVADEMGMLIVDETSLRGSAGNFYLGGGFRERAEAHVRELVLRDRNHPSVALWSVANEIGWVRPEGAGVKSRDEIYQIFADLAAEMKRLDPTREVSCDGDGDLGGRLPIYSLHYPGPDKPKTEAKTFTIGESRQMFYSRPSICSYRLGDRVYLSNDDRLEAVGLEMADLIEGYRQWAAYATPFNVQWYGLEPLPFDLQLKWERLDTPGVKPERIGPYCSGLNAWHDPKLPDFKPNPVYRHVADAFVPVRFFIRERSVSAYAPGTLEWPVAVHNDTMEDRELELRWAVSFGRRQVGEVRRKVRLRAGKMEIVLMAMRLPAVQQPEIATSAMELAEGRRRHYLDRRKLYVYPREMAASYGAPIAVIGNAAAREVAGVLGPGGVRVYAKLQQFWEWVEQVGERGVVVLAPDAGVDRQEAERLLAAVERGVRVLDMTGSGRLLFGEASDEDWVRGTFKLAFAKDLKHPILAGLEARQLQYWRPDGVVAREAFRGLPPRPMTPIVTCGDGYAAMLDAPVGAGRVLTCTLLAARSAEVEPAARVLLRNAVAWLAEAEPRRLERPDVFTGEDAALRMALYVLGLCDVGGREVARESSDRSNVMVVSAEALGNGEVLRSARECIGSGGRVLVVGVDRDTAEAVSQLVGATVSVSKADEIQLVPAPGHEEDPLLSGLDLADLCWLNEHEAQVILPWSIEVPGGEAILVNNRLDWRRWVQRGENFKPGAIKRSEMEPYVQKAGLVRMKLGGGEVLLSSIPVTATDTKSLRVLGQLLTNIGATWRGRRLTARERAEATLKSMGFITRWLTLGPIRGEDWQKLYQEDLLGGEEKARPALGLPGCGTTWTLRDFPPVAKLSEQELFGTIPNAAMYFAVYIMAPTPRRALLLVGSDDDVKVWVNGRLVHANSVARPVAADQDRAGPVELSGGWNLVLAKVVNRSGEWGFALRIVDESGRPFPDFKIAEDDPTISLREIGREGWKAQSGPPGDTAAAFDGRAETRWTTNKPMDDTMWFVLDMGRVYRVRRIVLDSSRSPGDWPRGLTLEVSTDGQQWQGVYRHEAGAFEGADGVVYITVPPT
ncbi:MAG: discoidin domain-containing protein, partial [Armatimonadetes bacterium]|nr:discoidin domain-containing protein [Armatimonadota bacterium]